MMELMTIRSMRDAKTVLRYAKIGVLPSQPVARAAKQQIEAFGNSDAGQVVDLTTASQVLGFAAIGALPCEEKCVEAIEQVNRALQLESEGVLNRPRYRN